MGKSIEAFRVRHHILDPHFSLGESVKNSRDALLGYIQSRTYDTRTRSWSYEVIIYAPSVDILTCTEEGLIEWVNL